MCVLVVPAAHGVFGGVAGCLDFHCGSSVYFSALRFNTLMSSSEAPAVFVVCVVYMYETCIVMVPSECFAMRLR